jgi:hypothetical protein
MVFATIIVWHDKKLSRNYVRANDLVGAVTRSDATTFFRETDRWDRPVAGRTQGYRSNSGLCGSRSSVGSLADCRDHTDEQAAGAEAGEVARHVAGDHPLLVPHRDHRHRCLRRHLQDLAIDEVVQHDVTDAQHNAVRELFQRGLVVEHQR